MSRRTKLKPYNLEVEQKYRDEPFEKMLRRFLKKLKKEGVVEDFLSHRYYVKPSEKKHLKNKNKKRLQQLMKENKK